MRRIHGTKNAKVFIIILKKKSMLVLSRCMEKNFLSILIQNKKPSNTEKCWNKNIIKNLPIVNTKE